MSSHNDTLTQFSIHDWKLLSSCTYEVMTIDANGNVVINEYKSSLTAPLTDNQKIAFPEISESGATVVGKGKGIFTGGYQIPPGTKVTIIRPE